MEVGEVWGRTSTVEGGEVGVGVEVSSWVDGWPMCAACASLVVCLVVLKVHVAPIVVTLAVPLGVAVHPLAFVHAAAQKFLGVVRLPSVHKPQWSS